MIQVVFPPLPGCCAVCRPVLKVYLFTEPLGVFGKVFSLGLDWSLPSWWLWLGVGGFWAPLPALHLRVRGGVVAVGLVFWTRPYGTIAFVYKRAWTGLNQRKNSAWFVLSRDFTCGWRLFGKWRSRVSNGKPSPSDNEVGSIFWVHGAVRGDRRQMQRKSFFPLPLVFLVSANSLQRFWGLVVWMLHIGTASNPGPGLEIELINVGGWLANCDEVFETRADFLSQLLSTGWFLLGLGMKSKRLRTAGFPSLWTPACQESAHVGHAGVGLVSLRGAPLLQTASATHEFREWVTVWSGLAAGCSPLVVDVWSILLWCMGFKGLMGIDEKLARTERLFQAVMCELRVVGDGHPYLLLGDFNIEPSKIPCLAKGISEGLIVDFEHHFFC